MPLSAPAMCSRLILIRRLPRTHETRPAHPVARTARLGGHVRWRLSCRHHFTSRDAGWLGARTGVAEKGIQPERRGIFAHLGASLGLPARVSQTLPDHRGTKREASAI